MENLKLMAQTVVEAVNVQLQQKIDGEMKNINPATLAPLVKMTDGADVQTKLTQVSSKLDGEAGKVSSLQGDMTQAKQDIAGLKQKDGQIDGEISGLKSKDTQLNEAIQAEASRAKGEEGKIRSELGQAKEEINQTINQKIEEVNATITGLNTGIDVYETYEEFKTAVAELTPKKGDMAYALDVRKAFVFKGAPVLAATMEFSDLPEGWVVFDDITVDADLNAYLKKSEANTTYRKVADKIQEADLHEGLKGKINGKADSSHVTSEIGRVEGLISGLDGRVEAVEGQTASISGLQSKIQALETAMEKAVFWTVIE